MNSLSRAILSLSLVVSLLPEAHAQRRHSHQHAAPAKPAAVAPKPAPTPAPAKPAAVQPTPAPVAPPTPVPVPSPAAVASPLPTATAKTDMESRSVSAYSNPASTLPVPTSTIQDMVVKLVGVVGLMLLGALGWRKLRRPNSLPKSKKATQERPEARLQVTEQMNLNPQQMLYVVQYAERRLLVGASPQNLNLITDLTPGTAALPATATAALPAPVAEALRELSPAPETVLRAAARTSQAPAPAPAPVAEDRFAGIFDRLRAQEANGGPSHAEYRMPTPAPRGEVKTIAELEEDQEELALAAAGRRSLFGNSSANGGTRWAGR